MIKKIITSILVLALLGAGSYYAWLAFGQPKTAPVILPTGPKAAKVSEERAISPYFLPGSQSAVFANPDGRIFRVSLSDGSFTELAVGATPAKNITKVLWSPAGNDFTSYSTVDKVTSKYNYNSAASKYTALAPNIIDFDWMPDGMRVAMVWQSGDKASQQLVISNGDGSGYKIISALPTPNYKIRVSPTGGEALLIGNNPAVTNNKIYLINLADGTYRPLVEQGNNLDAKWIDSNSFLFSRTDQSFPRINLFDLSKSAGVDLGVNTDLGRVAYDSFAKKIVAAIKADSGAYDKIVKIDPVTTHVEDYFKTDNLLVTELAASSNNIFYISATDGKLYRIK